MEQDSRLGGYTFDLLISGLPPEEQKIYEQAWVQLSKE